WMAVISSEAEKVAQATHMSASEAANYKAQLLAIAETQRQAKAAEGASNQAFGRVEQVQQIEAEIAALKQLQQANNTSDIRNAIAADIAQLDELKAKGGSVASSWKAYFAQMGVETQNVGVQLSGIFQKGFTSSIDSFSDALGKTIVQGKSLGEEMKKALSSIVEGIIAAIAKMLILKALSAATGGALGGGAADTGGGFLKSILGLSAGGIVPGAGIGDTVPAMLEPGEMVLPKNVVQSVHTSSSQTNISNGRNAPVIHYSPTVHAVDERG